MKTAFFVYRPRRLADLCRPHLLEEETPYRIASVVRLSPIEYENFSEDLLVDREFLFHRLPEGFCLLIQSIGRKDGILVYPEGEFVTWAAYLPKA